MKKNLLSKVLTFVLLLQMIMGIMSPSVFAAKGGGGTVKPLINGGDASVDLRVESGTYVSTNLTANMALNWKSTAPSKGTAQFSNVTNTNATTLTFNSNSNTSGTDTFTVTGTDPKNSKSKDTITINITIIPSAVDKTPPVNTVSPTIEGTFYAGDLLTANEGTWVDESTISFSYQWYLDNTPAAAVKTYTPLSSDVGKSIYVAVTATDTVGNHASANSAVYTIKTKPAEINYVALGDSIATGTVTPFQKIDTYVKYFYEYLVQQNPGQTVTLQNLSNDGDRSNELLSKLNTDSVMINAVKNAEVITISIGGNNLMQAAKTWLGLYDFFNINTTLAQQGAADFKAQWPLIAARLKELNSSAKIIVNTVYNPYNQSDSNGDSNAYMHSLVDGYLYANGTGINDIILSDSNSGSYYSTADIYQEYLPYSQSNTMGNIVYLYPDSLTRNPHPRYAGQVIITNCVKNAYNSK